MDKIQIRIQLGFIQAKKHLEDFPNAQLLSEERRTTCQETFWALSDDGDYWLDGNDEFRRKRLPFASIVKARGRKSEPTCELTTVGLGSG